MGACYSSKSGRIHIHRTTYDMDKNPDQDDFDDFIHKRKIPIARHKRLSPYAKNVNGVSDKNSKPSRKGFYFGTSDSFYKLSDETMPSKQPSIGKKSQLPVLSSKSNLNSVDKTPKCNTLNDSLNQTVAAVDSNCNGILADASFIEAPINTDKSSLKLLIQTKSLPKPQIPQLKISSQVFPQYSDRQSIPKNSNYFNKKSSFPSSSTDSCENDIAISKSKNDSSQGIKKKMNNNKLDAKQSIRNNRNEDLNGASELQCDSVVRDVDSSHTSKKETHDKDPNSSKKKYSQLQRPKTIARVMLNRPIRSDKKNAKPDDLESFHGTSQNNHNPKLNVEKGEIAKDIITNGDNKSIKALEIGEKGRLNRNIPSTQDIKKTLQSIENRIERTGKGKISSLSKYGFKSKKIEKDNLSPSIHPIALNRDTNEQLKEFNLRVEDQELDLNGKVLPSDESIKSTTSKSYAQDGGKKESVSDCSVAVTFFDKFNDMKFIDDDDATGERESLNYNDSNLGIDSKEELHKNELVLKFVKPINDSEDSISLLNNSSVEQNAINCVSSNIEQDTIKQKSNKIDQDASDLINDSNSFKSQDTQTHNDTVDRSDQTEITVEHKENQTSVEVVDQATFMSPVKSNKERDSYSYERSTVLSPSSVNYTDDPDFLIDDEICDQPELLIKSVNTTQLPRKKSIRSSKNISNKNSLKSCSLSSSIDSLHSETLMVEYEEISASCESSEEAHIIDGANNCSADCSSFEADSPEKKASKKVELAESSDVTPSHPGGRPHSLYSREVYQEWTKLVNSVDSSTSMVHTPNEKYIRSRVAQIPETASSLPEARSRVLFRQPRRMSCDLDEKGVRIDSPSYRCIVQDITSVKTLLFKLKRVLDETPATSPFENNIMNIPLLDQSIFDDNDLEKEQLKNGKIDYKQHLVDMKRMIHLQREQLKEKDHIIKMLQAQLLQTSQAKPYLSRHVDKVNMTTQTDKPRLLCDTSNEEPSGPYVSCDDVAVQ